MTPSKFFVAMAFLTALGRADVLIGREPCLWKRPVTQIANKFDHYDTVYYNDDDFFVSLIKPEKITGTGLLPIMTQQLDTTGWETYWDACPVDTAHGVQLFDWNLTTIPLGGRGSK